MEAFDSTLVFVSFSCSLEAVASDEYLDQARITSPYFQKMYGNGMWFESCNSLYDATNHPYDLTRIVGDS
ncbi:unnamed protein product [Adineta steineri]|uniref:Uncharacterized protein n=1 Tax=Adineta steineri TaxID=433720 RepID=A0A815JF38_9BILA|nr:unnamed protein product [Adineta steineri]